MQQQIEHRQQKRDEQIAPLLGRSERQRANAPTGKWRSLPTRTAGDFSVGGGLLLAEKQRQLTACNQANRRFHPLGGTLSGWGKAAC